MTIIPIKIDENRYLITPDIARALLEKNIDNRKVQWSVVSRYAADMAANAWKFTGEPVTFSISGRMLNGQHRMLACVKADTPFVTNIVWGLDDDSFQYMDSGAKRSDGDALSKLLLTHQKQSAAAVRLVLQWRANQLRNASALATVAPRRLIIAFAEQHTDAVAHGVRLGGVLRNATRVNESATSALAIELIIAGYSASCEEFIGSTAKGANLNDGDPRLTLRTWALHAGGRATTRHDHLWAIVRSWNAWATGEELRMIRAWAVNASMPVLAMP